MQYFVCDVLHMFCSDIYFAYIVVNDSLEDDGDQVYFWLAILCPLFVIVPYLANMYAAITLYKNISMNNMARLYFENRLVFFCALVLISGGVHASIQLVSSKIFGLAIFDCGLSKRELTQFTGIQVTHSVILENVPQVKY